MSPEAMLVVLETLMTAKVELENQHKEISDAIDILVAEMKAANMFVPSPSL